LQARSLSAQDVAAALAALDILTPIGSQKIGDREYTLQLNSPPSAINELGLIPPYLPLFQILSDVSTVVGCVVAVVSLVRHW
jgi:multidrug efflux pump subunit AcrB